MNLKAIKLDALPRLPIEQRFRLPGIPAIYFVMYQNQVLYVGKAKHLRNRWVDHHRLDEMMGYPLEIRWMRYPVHLLDSAEEAAIAITQPPMNQNLLRAPCVLRLSELIDENGKLTMPSDEITRSATYGITVPADMLNVLARQARAERKAVGRYVREIALYSLQVQVAMLEELGLEVTVAPKEAQ